MSRGRKIDDEVREQANALLMTGNTATYVAEQLNLPYTTVKTWENILKENNSDEFVAVRQKKKEAFIESAWGLIEKSKTILERRLDRAIESEQVLDLIVDEITSLDKKELTDSQRKSLYNKIATIKVDGVKEIAIVLATLYDKQALASKEATEIIDGSIAVKKFEDF